jgi:pimeloyl-ACP methyl ester carboxylesterase
MSAPATRAAGWASPEARLTAFPAHEARVAGEPLAYRTAGSGLPLMLLHGIGAPASAWIRQLEDPVLTRRFRIIAWDAPGYGGSAGLSHATPGAADYAARLHGLLDVLGIGRCVLLGQSLGALMAAAFAARWPERLYGLVLLSPAQGYGRSSTALRAEKLHERLQAMERLGPAGLAAARAANLLAANPAPEALELVRWNMAQLRPEGHAQAAHMLSGGCLLDDAAAYRGPVLVACGSEDRVTPPAGCRALAQSLPGSAFELLPGLGHAGYAEDPAQIRQLIERFARRCGAIQSDG